MPRPRSLLLALLALGLVLSPTVVQATPVHAGHPAVLAKRPGKASDHTWLTGKRPVRWGCGTITYRVNPVHAPQGWRKTLTKSMKKVTQASGIRFQYVGRTKAIPRSRSRNPRGTDLVVAYVKRSQTNILPKSAIGVGGAFSNGHQLFNGGIAFNGQVLGSMPNGFGAGNTEGIQGSQGEVVMHELGHVVGLGHAKSASQIMYYAATGKKASWGAGDFAGLRILGKRGCRGGHRETAPLAAVPYFAS